MYSRHSTSAISSLSGTWHFATFCFFASGSRFQGRSGHARSECLDDTVANDPQRHFATADCRRAGGLFDRLGGDGEARQLLDL